jgi:hypothetical protein
MYQLTWVMAASGWGELRPGEEEEESPHGTWEVVRTSADVEVICPTDPHAGRKGFKYTVLCGQLSPINAWAWIEVKVGAIAVNIAVDPEVTTSTSPRVTLKCLI